MMGVRHRAGGRRDGEALQMMTFILLGVMVLVAAYAIWRNMSDGPGNNRVNTRNRGIGGDRGNSYGDGDLS
jgi:hypothetical protein